MILIAFRFQNLVYWVMILHGSSQVAELVRSFASPSCTLSLLASLVWADRRLVAGWMKNLQACENSYTVLPSSVHSFATRAIAELCNLYTIVYVVVRSYMCGYVWRRAGVSGIVWACVIVCGIV